MTGWTCSRSRSRPRWSGRRRCARRTGSRVPCRSRSRTVAYVASFALLALTLKHLSLGTTYAIWSGVGTVAIAFIGRLVYHELISFATAAGIALVVVGVVVIHRRRRRVTMTQLMNGDDTERQGGRQRTIQSVDRAAMLIKAIADSRQPPTVDRARRGVRAEPQHRLAAARDARRARPDRARPGQPALQPRLRVPPHRGGRGARPARAAGAAGARAARATRPARRRTSRS